MKGDQGPPGTPGPIGYSGPPGQQGVRGPPGSGYSGVSHSFFIARHSQTIHVPDCPRGSTLLYSGYSLLYVLAGKRGHGQDLGAMGSCLQRFSTIPFLFCEPDATCRYGDRSYSSYWLSTDKRMPMNMLAISGHALSEYISRCSVCETTSNVIAVHSQSTDEPVCPLGWRSLWTGYSFVMQTGDRAEGSGQSLISPGSCLEHFRQVPFIECHEKGTCNYFQDAYSYWLASLDHRHLFRKPESKTVKGQILSTIISRCNVCMKP